MVTTPARRSSALPLRSGFRHGRPDPRPDRFGDRAMCQYFQAFRRSNPGHPACSVASARSCALVTLMTDTRTPARKKGGKGLIPVIVAVVVIGGGGGGERTTTVLKRGVRDVLVTDAVVQF